MRSKNNLEVVRFTGQVYAHSGRGTSLGFPTANLKLRQPLEHGIFISRTQVNGEWHPSVTFIGVPKTFSEEAQERAETHILKGTYELVGQTITVELLQFLRPNQKFSSIPELIKAITADVAEAQAYFEQDLASN